ncbi:nucleoside-binding protein [Sanguibacter gelidistatuariae]|uniref:Nucleoside-binding protein n=1 Tax=Sanguibacter gelidistatuariae TaxID=1814289 RepID=A0A1G6MI98_9MICO|nr:BMP family ABC transporter substrate-binding protein [Sanguibacter gelidistatuariae]SDC55210.1 nucleoside-binding protein [Sanguibacter gelidistatuariae]
MKRVAQFAAVTAVAALALTACGSAPDDTPTTSAGATTTAAAESIDFKACMVSDAGGFDDKSFNESGIDGLKAAAKTLGIETATQESKTDSDFAPNIDNLVTQNCNIIVTVGYLLATATGDAAKANPGVDFAIVDSTAADADNNPIELDNVKPLSFDTAQAAYLAGYVAAGMTKTGTVATFGGIQIPSVTIFMDGFVDGVAKYNEDNATTVKVLGWDKAKQNGSFTGDFDDQSKGQQLTQTFIDAGADIIMPVAGPVGAGSLAAARDAKDVSVIWVDTDGAVSNPTYADIILTSVVKEIGASVEDAITTSSAGKFSADPYVGTLDNGGVSIAPFHDFDAKVPQELKDKVDQLRKDIISGSIVVESPSSP